MAQPKRLNKRERERRRKINNAKRRYRRQAERWEREAQTTQDGEFAASLQEGAQNLRNLADSLNGIDVRKKLNKDVTEKIRDSKRYLVSVMKTDKTRGDALGRAILSGNSAGTRFFAMTESLWSGAAYKQRYNRIAKALMKDPDIRAQYPNGPTVYDMIGIIGQTTGLDVTTDDEVTDSKDLVIMLGVSRILRQYG